jgi:hypothetical protein
MDKGASEAWLRMQARAGGRKQPTLPGCRCSAPWHSGHKRICPERKIPCDDCGMVGGKHHWDCMFWELHPLLTPF